MAENLAVKNANWDKKDGIVTSDDKNDAMGNCYPSYNYNPASSDTSIIDKFKMHGGEFSENADGGQLIKAA